MTVGEELAAYNRGVRAALKWAAGQVEKEADEARGDRGEDTEASFKLRRLAAQIREGAP